MSSALLTDLLKVGLRKELVKSWNTICSRNISSKNFPLVKHVSLVSSSNYIEYPSNHPHNCQCPLHQSFIIQGQSQRHLSTTGELFSRQTTSTEVVGGEAETAAKDAEGRDPTKDRTRVIPWEVSAAYLKSAAYRETYGDIPGQFLPRFTRLKCIRNGMISTGNPCPVCRDEYLVIHHRNVELLKQFISPYNGDVLPTIKTQICREQHHRLLVELGRAKELGLLSFDFPVREYDYKEYYEPAVKLT